MDQQIDYLFVGEAGQVSLANTVAMGVSARNVILVGGPDAAVAAAQGQPSGPIRVIGS